jgi:glycosyltransferase involved in cell wall biosynthesis
VNEYAYAEAEARPALRVCIASQSKLGITDTFIRAHIDRLPFAITTLFGYGLAFETDGRPLLASWHARPRAVHDRLLNILPRFLEFRIREHFLPSPDDAQIVAQFLRERRLDVVLAEYGTTAAFITPACKKAGIPLIAHFHGFDASHFETLERFRDSYRSMFEYASSVVVVSNAMRATLVTLGCDPGKITVNHYGPNPVFFDVKPDYGSDTVLAVGRLTAQKAPHLTILAFKRALEKAPNLRLRMIGDGELFEVCRDLVNSMGLADRVLLTGAASHHEVVTAMHDAFLFVQHSVAATDGNREGTPVAIIEAGAAGLPVVSTRHEGIPDVVVDGTTGLIGDERDVEQMADSIARFANNRALASTMGSAARLRIRNSFSMERHIARLGKLIEDVASSAPRYSP